MSYGHHARRSASRHRCSLLIALTLLLLGVGTGPASAVQTPPGGSWVRAAHLLPGAQQMQVILAPADGAGGTVVTLSSDLSYGQATQYRALAPGNYAVTVRPVAATEGDPPMLSSTYAAAAGKAFTLAVLGTVSAPRLAVLQDDLKPPASGHARVRVLPAASRATQVTVQAAAGPTIATDAVFGQPTPYASVPAGTWRLSAMTSSGQLSGAGTVALSSGAVYTLLIVDGVRGGLQLTTLQDAAGVQVAPSGGLATGGGGTAPGGGEPVPVGAVDVVLAGLLMLTALVLAGLLLGPGKHGVAARRLRLRP